MPSIKDFVEALSASWPVALAALIGSSALVLTQVFDLEVTRSIPAWGISVAFVVAVFAAAVLIVSVIRSLGSLIVRARSKRSWKRMKTKQLADLASLPQAEALVVLWAAANKTQVISAPYFHPAIQALRAKLLLEEIAGSHMSNQVPFRFPDHIWEVIAQDYARSPVGEILRGKPFPNPDFYTLG